MRRKKEHIFQPIKIGPLLVKNRIEVAPAAPFMAGHDASVSQELYEYTVGLAKSGAGIVTIGVTGVDPRAPIGMRTLNAGSRIFLSDLNDMAEGIKRYGAVASIELVHSKYMLTPGEIVANLPTEEVEKIIQLFADAALRCQQAGFDMIMIHGGHGNVPSMFFNKKLNQRTDRFGGSFENRCQFGIELLQAIREKTDNKLAIEYRISAEEMLPDMTTFEETLEYAKVIQNHIDLLHVSRGLLEVDALLPYINAPVYLPKAMNLPFARKFKEVLSIPVSVVGSFDLDNAEKAIADGDVDMVAMMRTVLADTMCVDKARRGKDEEIRPCIRCNVCISRTHSMFQTVRCAVNPVIGRETRFDLLHKAEISKRIVIIGGGPAGMEAARVASQRGHHVVLFERESELGGTFKLACGAEFKKELQDYLDWSIRTVMHDDNIEIKLSTKATRELIEREKPEVLLLAVGAEPIIPKFTASGTSKIVWAGEAEAGKASIGNKLIIAGAGFTGMELALSLSRQGKKVKLIDMLPEDQIGLGGTPINLICLKDLLQKEEVEFRCGVKISDITNEGVFIVNSAGNSEIICCDTVVLSFGFRPNYDLINSFNGITDDVFAIGDCTGTGGTVWNATRTAFDKVMQL